MSPPLPEKPYKFLDSYGIEDAGIFFGRERETRVLLSDVLVNRLVVLFARTGTGKTSLINAGVRPRLAEQGYATFFIRVHRDPAASAETEILARTGLQTLPGQDFAEQLEGLVQKLGQPVVLFFDQFEEFFLYTHRPDPEKGQAFIADVARLYRNRDSGVHLVFSMREEFFVEMDAFRDEIPTIFHNDSNLRLRRFDRTQARDAIVHPARAFGVQIAPDLVERLLHDLSAGTTAEIEPAQLQIVCDTLWDCRQDGEIGLAQYEALGREGRGNVAEQVLFDRLERVFAAIETPEELDLLARLLPHLRTADGTKWVRDVEGLRQALASEVEVEALDRTLELLVRLRFLQTGQRDGMMVVELSHDYLVGHLDELGRRVRLIWPRRQLWRAAARFRSSGALATVEELEAVDVTADQLPLTRADSWMLLRSGLEHGYKLRRWFELAQAHGLRVWDRLRSLFDEEGTVVAVGHALELYEELLYEFQEPAGQLPPLFQFLFGALRRPDLTLAAQETVARLTAAKHWRVAGEAFHLLEGFLSIALPRDRIASSSITALGQIEQRRSVDLLRRALRRDDLSREAQEALVRLSAEGSEVSEFARNALYTFLSQNLNAGSFIYPITLQALGRIETHESVGILARALKIGGMATGARAALEQLAGGNHADVAKAALEELTAGFVSGAAAHSFERSGSLGISDRPRSTRGSSDSTVRSIAEAVKSRECVLLLGAGVHAPPPPEEAALYPDSDRPPSSRELAYELAQLCSYESRRPGKSPYDFRRVTQFFELSSGRQALIEELQRSIEPGKQPSPMLRALAQLSFPLVITTNFDTLLEGALSRAGKQPEIFQFSQPTPPSPGTADRPLIAKLHGDFRAAETLVLTEDDLVDFTMRLSSTEPLPPFVRSTLRRCSLLFVGFNLWSLDTRFLLRSLIPDRRDRPAYVLQPDPEPEIVQSLERKYGVRFLNDDLWSFVPALYEAVTGDPLRLER